MGTIDRLIEDFDFKMTSTSINAENYKRNELKSNMIEILNEMHRDYDRYILYISQIIKILDRNKNISRDILIDIYLECYNNLQQIEFEAFDTKILTEDVNDNTLLNWERHLDKSFSSNIQLRVSDFIFDSDGLTYTEKLEIISMVRVIIQKKSENLIWDEDVIYEVLVNLSVARSLLDEIKNSSYFYFLASMVMDRYNTSQFYQNARDFSEELIITSYNQKIPYWGFYLSFKCYSNNSSAIAALFYANLSLLSVIDSKKLVNKDFLRTVIWEGIKFFRNIGLHQVVEKIYHSIPHNTEFDKYNIRSIKHSYFLSLLSVKDTRTPDLVLEFLNENREEMLSYGSAELLPWLITLYNLQYLNLGDGFMETQFQQYITLFESIVPFETYSPTKAIFFGDLPDLKDLLKKALINLAQTRYSLDFVNDNKHAIQIATKIIEPAVFNNDTEALLLSMVVKTDYTYVITEKSRQNLAPIEVPNPNTNQFDELYWKFADVVKKIEVCSATFLWIFQFENKYASLTFSKLTFIATNLESWDYHKLKKLFKQQFFTKLSFDSTVKKMVK